MINVGPDFYIHTSSLSSRRATSLLLNGESFAVFELRGDISQTTSEPLGFFYRDTRHLSRFELKVGGEIPYYLNSYTSQENAQLRINLSNPELSVGENRLPKNSIQIERSWVMADGALFHKVTLQSYAHFPVEIPLEFVFEVDFADLFEVRGFRRVSRGHQSEPVISGPSVTFPYQGLDGIRRFTKVTFEPEATLLRADRASLGCLLRHHERLDLEVRIISGRDERGIVRTAPRRYDLALAQRRSEIAQLETGWARISASHKALDSLLQRSTADLTSMIRSTPTGSFLIAGIPWFATLFGRDSILSSLFLLPFNPTLGAGTLKILASLQGSQVNPQSEEQPGKIVHEIRAGELAATGAVPFGRYYGSIDATPLFLWLLGRYVATTGDLNLADQLWQNVERAFTWIERWGTYDGDIYVKYLSKTPDGLANQGWKDSSDAISHADGTLARPPVALCEVQSYVYAAYCTIAEIAQRLGRNIFAERLGERAAVLRSRFVRDFWLERERTVALALDGDRQPCRVMSSNAGHCLLTDLLDGERVEALAERLMSSEMFTGWGVRTLGSSERRYNPMSYHNGSLWPHDNALIAAGLAHSMNRQNAVQILEALMLAAGHLRTGSLPELFCGFPRDEQTGPIPYPVACHPQAWSAASIFMLVQAILGIEVRGLDRKLIFSSPAMPTWLDWLKIENLRIGDGRVSLLVRRSPEGASLSIIELHGDLAIEILNPAGKE